MNTPRTLTKHRPPSGAPGPPLPACIRAAALANGGSLMVEVVAAVMVFTLVGSAVLVGLSTSHISSAQTESQAIADNLGRSQMEYVFSLPYQDPASAYPSIVTPPGYTVSALAEEYQANVQTVERVVVTVGHDGDTVLTLETLRVRE